MGGGGSQTSTQKSEPWSGQQPYLKDLFQQGQNLYRQGPQEFYPGVTVAPFAPQQQQAMDMTTNRALSGSPQEQAFGGYLSNQLGQPNIDPMAIARMLGQAQNAFPAADQFAVGGMQTGANAANQLANTASGGFLGSNPYLDQVYNTAAGRAGEAFQENVLPGINATFGAGGRTGGGIHQQMMENASRQFGRDLQGMAANIYAPAYESERDRMVQAGSAGANYGLGAGRLGADIGLGAMGGLADLYGTIGQNQFRAGSLVPTYSGLEYGNMDRLMGVGNQIQGQAQDIIGGNMQRWGFEQQAPWNNLNNYASIIQGLPGGYGTQTSTQPKGSRLSGAAGGAMTGAALGPWGALGGAVLGGLLG